MEVQLDSLVDSDEILVACVFGGTGFDLTTLTTSGSLNSVSIVSFSPLVGVPCDGSYLNMSFPIDEHKSKFFVGEIKSVFHEFTGCTDFLHKGGGGTAHI